MNKCISSCVFPYTTLQLWASSFSNGSAFDQCSKKGLLRKWSSEPWSNLTGYRGLQGYLAKALHQAAKEEYQARKCCEECRTWHIKTCSLATFHPRKLRSSSALKKQSKSDLKIVFWWPRVLMWKPGYSYSLKYQNPQAPLIATSWRLKASKPKPKNIQKVWEAVFSFPKGLGKKRRYQSNNNPRKP